MENVQSSGVNTKSIQMSAEESNPSFLKRFRSSSFSSEMTIDEKTPGSPLRQDSVEFRRTSKVSDKNKSPLLALEVPCLINLSLAKIYLHITITKI